MSGQRTVQLKLDLDEVLLEKARESEIDITQAAETGILQAVERLVSKADEQARWLSENKEAFETLRRHSEENGLPMSRYRQYPWPDSTSM